MNFIEELFAGVGIAETMKGTILEELSALKEMLKRIEALLEERLIGIEELSLMRLGLSRSMRERRKVEN